MIFKNLYITLRRLNVKVFISKMCPPPLENRILCFERNSQVKIIIESAKYYF